MFCKDQSQKFYVLNLNQNLIALFQEILKRRVYKRTFKLTVFMIKRKNISGAKNEDSKLCSALP